MRKLHLSRGVATEKALTRAQLADQLGLSESTIDRRRREGMPCFVVGVRSPRFYLSECVEWLTHNGRQKRQEAGIGTSTVVWSLPQSKGEQNGET